MKFNSELVKAMNENDKRFIEIYKKYKNDDNGTNPKELDSDKKFYSKLIQSFKGQKSINDRNRLSILKQLVKTKDYIFPFIELLNSLKSTDNIQKINNFKLNTHRLMLGSRVPFHCLARHYPNKVKYIDFQRLFNGQVHPDLENELHLLNNEKEGKIHLFHNSNIIHEKNPNYLQLIEQAVLGIEKYLEQILDGYCFSAHDHVSINYISKLIRSSLYRESLWIEYNEANNLFVRSYYDLIILFEIDLLRNVQLFGQEFLFERIKKCEWCQQYYIAKDLAKTGSFVFCDRNCNRTLHNQ